MLEPPGVPDEELRSVEPIVNLLVHSVFGVIVAWAGQVAR
jgi:hypothetical protein